jgi:hypothetical protein
MAKFKVVLTRDAVLSAVIEVEGDTRDEAEDLALIESWTIDNWEEVSSQQAEVDSIKQIDRGN